MRLTIIAAGCAGLALWDALTLDRLFLVIAAGMLSFGLFNALTLRRFAWRSGRGEGAGTSRQSALSAARSGIATSATPRTATAIPASAIGPSGSSRIR